MACGSAGQLPRTRNFYRNSPCPAVELDYLTAMFFRFTSASVRQYGRDVPLKNSGRCTVNFLYDADEPARDVSGDAFTDNP